MISQADEGKFTKYNLSSQIRRTLHMSGGDHQLIGMHSYSSQRQLSQKNFCIQTQLIT